jgi:hypothetical protein
VDSSRPEDGARRPGQFVHKKSEARSQKPEIEGGFWRGGSLAPHAGVRLVSSARTDRFAYGAIGSLG